MGILRGEVEKICAFNFKNYINEVAEGK